MITQQTSLKISVLLFAAMAAMLLAWPIRFADGFFLDLWISFFWALGIGLASDLDDWKGKALTFFFALLPIAAAAIYYGVSFSSEESFLVAGVIPWSDASMYFRQAAQMAVEGITQTGMNGRFLYPAYFSSLLNMTGCHLLWAHALSGIFFAGALTLLLNATASICRAPGAMICALVCWLFYRAHCAGLVMTENLGIICGLLATTFFLHATERRSLRFFLSGLFILSLGLCARPGALFVLPLMVLFIGFAAWFGWNGLPEKFSKIWKSVIAAFLALVVIAGAFGSNRLIEQTLYQGNVIANGNFSFTLYGMLTGGKWSDGASSFHWNAQRAMEASLHLVKEKPQLLIMGAARAYKEAVARRILFMFNHESRPATLLSLLALVGLIAVWRVNSLRSSAWWITLMAAGIIFSIPFAPPWDAAERPFAATVPFQGLMAGIGLFALLRWAFSNWGESSNFAFFLPAAQELKIRNLMTDPSVVTFLAALLFLLSVPFPIAHSLWQKYHEQPQQQDDIMLRAGSVVTLTPQNYEDIRRRMTSFLIHNPDQQFLFTLLTDQSSLGINWENKNFERSIILPSASEKNLMNINGWKVDNRLLPATSLQK